jgi:hypothetical protein
MIITTIIKNFYYYLNFILLIRKEFKKLNKNKNIVLIEIFDLKPTFLAFALYGLALSKYFSARVAIHYPTFFNIKKKIKHMFQFLNPIYIENIYKICFDTKLIILPKKDHNIDLLYKSSINNIKNKKNFRDLKLKGIWVGDLFYDEYLRTNDLSTVNIEDINFKKSLYRYIKLFEYWYQKLSKKKIKGMIISHNVYLIGLPARIMLSFNKPVYSIRLTDAVYLTKKYKQAFSGFKEYPKIFKKLNPKEKKIGIKQAQTQLNKRFSGKDDILYKTNQKNDHAVFLSNKITTIKKPKKNKFKILVAAHCFNDAPHVYGKNIFCDFYEWIDFLGKQTLKSKFDWYLKVHPAVYNKNLKKFNYFLKKYPKFKLLPKYTSHNQLIMMGINVVLTVYGSIAHEYPLFKIPVINAGLNPHVGYKFSITPKNLNEYKKILKNIEKIELKTNVKNQILEYYYMSFLFNETPFSKILNGNENKNSNEIFKDFFDKKLDKNIKEIIFNYQEFIKSKKRRNEKIKT